MWGRSGYSQYGYQQDYKQELKNLDKHNIINFNRVNMGTSNVNTYLNSLSLDLFLNILNDKDNFDRYKINQLLEEKNGWSKKYKRSDVYRHVIQNPDKYKKSNRRNNGKNNKKYNNARKNGIFKGELDTINLTLKNNKTKLSKKILEEYKISLKYHKRTLGNKPKNYLKNERQKVDNLLRVINTKIDTIKKNNEIKKSKRKEVEELLINKINTLIEQIKESGIKNKSINIKVPSNFSQENLKKLENMVEKTKELAKNKKEKNIFSRKNKINVVIKTCEDILRIILSLLKNIPQSGGRKKYIINPLTGRKILKNGPTARKLNL